MQHTTERAWSAIGASIIDAQLQSHSIVTVEFHDGPMHELRMLCPSTIRRLYFEGFSDDARTGRRPLITSAPATPARHVGYYDAEMVYDCPRTGDAVLRMRWTEQQRAS